MSHGTEVMVLDADDYTVVGKIEVLSRCQVARDLGIAFIKDGDGRPVAAVQEVVVLELKTLKVTGRVKTGQPDTDAIIYEPVTKHIFTFNDDSHNTPVIDAAKESACERRDAALAVLSIAVYFTGGPINHQVRVIRAISRQTIHRCSIVADFAFRDHGSAWRPLVGCPCKVLEHGANSSSVNGNFAGSGFRRTASQLLFRVGAKFA